MDLASLTRIKDILEDFGNVSGLVCNVEKTCLMQIGSDLPIQREIIDLGYNILTILGMQCGGGSESEFP